MLDKIMNAYVYDYDDTGDSYYNDIDYDNTTTTDDDDDNGNVGDDDDVDDA